MTTIRAGGADKKLDWQQAMRIVRAGYVGRWEAFLLKPWVFATFHAAWVYGGLIHGR